jgi:TM2 domain-containing membrane protein YozV
MPDANDLRVKMQFDRLMTSARVYIKRGEMGKAGEAVVQALELRPGDLDARELAADMVLASGDVEKAAAHYKVLFSPERPRPSAEEKYAKAILQIAEEQYQREQLAQMLANPTKAAGPPRSPLLAAIASIGPGFGQMYLGNFRRGVIFFGVVIISWMLFYYLSPPVGNFTQQNALTMREFFGNMSASAVMFACIAAFAHVYAFIDAVMSAGKKPAAPMPEFPSTNEKQNTPGPQ